MENAVARKVGRKVVKVMEFMSNGHLPPKGPPVRDEKALLDVRLKSAELRVDALEKRTSPAQ